MEKVCKKCGVSKPISDFYAQKKTNGYFSKCKECYKNDVHLNYQKNIQSEEFVEKERQRGRDKYRRLGYIARPTAHKENSNTSRKMKRLGLVPNGNESHHWNYNLMYDVFFLDRRAHKLVHKYLKYDEKTKMFINSETGELLDSREKHYDFIVEVFRKNGHVETGLLYAKRA